MSAPGPRQQAFVWQRVENALIAVGIIIAMIAWGQLWWLLPATFLAFDLSALGYLISQRVGAFSYNLVHNYAPPAVAVIAGGSLHLIGVEADWLLLLAACWGFHVAVDRSLGFGLKLGPFNQTHLGAIGSASPRRS